MTVYSYEGTLKQGDLITVKVRNGKGEQLEKYGRGPRWAYDITLLGNHLFALQFSWPQFSFDRTVKGDLILSTGVSSRPVFLETSGSSQLEAEKEVFKLEFRQTI